MEEIEAKAGHRLNTFINNLGVSKSEISRKTGLDYSHLHRILKGDTDPGFDTCTKFYKAYPELSLTWLITGDGEMYNITRQERNDIQRVRAWREENSIDTSAVLYLFKAEQLDLKYLGSTLRSKNVDDKKVIDHIKGVLLDLFIERRDVWADLYSKFKNDYSAEKDKAIKSEEEVLEDMHGSPELKELDEYIASFCSLVINTQSWEIANNHSNTRG